MTIDDAIKGFETFAELLEVEKDFLNDSEISEEMEKQKQLAEWLKDYKRLKEQEPCEDAVSRQAVIETIFVQGSAEKLEIDFAKLLLLQRAIKALPSVTPQEPKTGHWIEGQTNNPNIHNILCSRCFEGYPSKGHANSQHTKEKFKWCPKCGARMVEPQESEDKE